MAASSVSLKDAAKLIGKKEFDCSTIIKTMQKTMEGMDIEYINIVNRDSSLSCKL